jgi:hypothetical protein
VVFAQFGRNSFPLGVRTRISHPDATACAPHRNE